jgi:hypothetical protein
MCQAKVKLSKVGEPLAIVLVLVDGNTEPIPIDNSIGECVETRRRVCIKCNNVITINSKKYCSTRCRSAYLSYQHRVKTGLIKKPGVGSGGNQWGKDNHQYKTGIGTYKNLALSSKKHECERCASTNRLEVHHKDHNRKNNELQNLEILFS